MIVDSRTLPAGTDLAAEICIIGSGPAGIALAREFLHTSISLIVLESGGLGFEPASEALNAGESVGLPYLGLTNGRRRQFGGTANIWGAVCVELDATDFEHRPWIASSGWPISATTVAPYYDRARDLFALARTDLDAADWRAVGMQSAPFDAGALRFSVAGSTPIPDLGKTYRDYIRDSANVKLVLHATVTTLETNAAGSAIERVEFRLPNGERRTVAARAVVLCCGGIENARLLLASRATHRAGLGNAHDLVGRYLADHTMSFSARITPRPERRLQPMFRSVRRYGSSLRPRLALSPEVQARAGVLNCMAQIHFEHAADGGFVAAHNLRRALRFRRLPAQLGRDIANVLRHPRELSKLAFDRYVRGRHPATNGSELFLECVAEQAPNPSSRVTLSRRRDHFGTPLPVVDWRTDELERRTIACMTETVAQEFARLHLGRVDPEPWLTERGSTDWPAHLVEGFHHLGTTRMAASPQAGVVDADGRVHDVAGLYVAGSSVFPAAGYANGTLTIVALAIRLADHLKRRAFGAQRLVRAGPLASSAAPPNEMD